MKNFVIYLAAGASALLMTAASAAPLSPNPPVAPERYRQRPTKKPRRNPRLFDAHSNGSARAVSRHRAGAPTSCSQPYGLHTCGAFAPRKRSTNQKAQIVTNERTKNPPQPRRVDAALISMTSSRG